MAQLIPTQEAERDEGKPVTQLHQMAPKGADNYCEEVANANHKDGGAKVGGHEVGDAHGVTAAPTRA